MIRAGTLDRRIVIQTNTPAQDGYGEPVASWSTLATVWARYEALTGRERFVADQVAAEIDARFTIRYRSDVTPKQRVTWDSKTWDIAAVLEEGRREALHLLCTARSDD